MCLATFTSAVQKQACRKILALINNKLKNSLVTIHAQWSYIPADTPVLSGDNIRIGFFREFVPAIEDILFFLFISPTIMNLYFHSKKAAIYGQKFISETFIHSPKINL